MLATTGIASFAFSTAKWFFQGSDYGCGLGAWPTFGVAAMKYTWNFDWQLNYVGAGAVCVHVSVMRLLPAGCVWPAFGVVAVKYTLNFDWLSTTWEQVRCCIVVCSLQVAAIGLLPPYARLMQLPCAIAPDNTSAGLRHHYFRACPQ